jgi:chromate transporter
MGGMRDVLAELAWTFATLSPFSIGGISVLLPEIRHQAVDVHGWMTDAVFGHLLAIATAAPGPNGMVVALVGWQAAGLPGLLVSALAMMTPPSILTFVVARALARWPDSKIVSVLKDALVPVGLGLMMASGVVIMRSVDRDLLLAAISIGAAAFVLFTRHNLLWALGAGTLANVIALHI